jgi:hypothetical protein
MMLIVVRRSCAEGKEKLGLLDELPGRTGMMAEPLSA